MNTLGWQVCKCGLSTIFTDRETMAVNCPQCHTLIAPITQLHSMQSHHCNSVKVLYILNKMYKKIES